MKCKFRCHRCTDYYRQETQRMYTHNAKLILNACLEYAKPKHIFRFIHKRFAYKFSSFFLFSVFLEHSSLSVIYHHLISNVLHCTIIRFVLNEHVVGMCRNRFSKLALRNESLNEHSAILCLFIFFTFFVSFRKQMIPFKWSSNRFS